MNVNGLWTLSYRVGNFMYSMVATINGNRLTGGNNCYYCVGDVKINGDTLSGEVISTHYFGELDPALNRLSKFTLSINAKLGNGIMQGTAKIAELNTELGFTGNKRD